MPSRSSSSPASPFLRLVLSSVLVGLHILSAQSVSCQTPLTFSEHRLPAVLEIENFCSNNNVAMCLEFDGTVYLIQNMDPTSLYTVPSVLEDCWVFRASDCQGETLHEHLVTGTRKLTIGCTKEWTDANAIGFASSTPLDCSLTITPLLSAVYDGAMEFVPSNKKQDIAPGAFEDLNAPMQFAAMDELLRTVFKMCHVLAWHGVDVTSAMNIFKHFRAVLRHTQKCRPEQVGSLIGIAQSYFGLYGTAFANLHASNRIAGTWIDTPAPLTAAQQSSLQALIDHAVGIDLAVKLPESALPTTLQGLPTVSVRAVFRQAASPTPSPISASLTGEEICNAQGVDKWMFHKMSTEAAGNSTLDCCSPSCFAFDKTVTLVMRPFTTSCCLTCNMGWCGDDIPAEARAVMQMGEIQESSNTTTAMDEPIKIMI